MFSRSRRITQTLKVPPDAAEPRRIATIAEDAWWHFKTTTQAEPAFAQLQRTLELRPTPRMNAMLALVTLRQQIDLPTRCSNASKFVDKSLKLDPTSDDALWTKSQIDGLQHCTKETIEALQACVTQAESGHLDPLINFDTVDATSRLTMVKDALKNIPPPAARKTATGDKITRIHANTQRKTPSHSSPR